MKKHAGFTLIELMVVIALAAILLVLATPSFRSQIQNNRAATQANQLLTALNLARSEAIKRGVRVSACSSTNQSTCAGSADWATGWIVFADTDTTGTAGSLDSGDTLLKTWNTLKGNSALAGADSTGTSNVTNVQYLPTGMAEGPGTFPVTFTLTPADCTGTQRRVIRVSAPGQAVINTTTCP